MLKKRAPRYCHGFTDRHGKPRWYLRRPGFKAVALPGMPWSPTFMAAYEAAQNGQKIEPGASRTLPGTVNAVCVSYYESARFKSLRPATKATYRAIIERFREAHGNNPIAGLRREHVKVIVEAKADKPSAAGSLLKMLRVLLDHAIELGLIETNVAMGVKPIRAKKTGGFKTWSEVDIAQFKKRWPIGTRQRLALELLLCTGQRRSDVVRMGPQHVCGGVLTIQQQKTGSEVSVPVHPDLADAISKTETGDTAFLMTSHSKAFVAAGFGNWFRDACDAAGLNELASHGLRKAACRRLAEAGCTPHQIMAISGHVSLKEVVSYTRAANRTELARSAFERLEQYRNKDLQTVSEDLQFGKENTGKSKV